MVPLNVQKGCRIALVAMAFDPPPTTAVKQSKRSSWRA
jgi:hypothetical protein